MRLHFILLGVGLCALQATHAAEWAVNANIDQNFSYQDNVRMLEEKQGSFVYELTPVLNARYTTQNSEIAASASYGIQRYAEIPEFDQDNQNYSLLGNYQAERTTYTLSTNYSKEPVRNFADDTGINNTAADRIRWSVDPAIVYRITPQDSLNIQASYSEQLYSTNQLTDNRFADNQNAVIDLSWTRQWTERYTGGFNVIYYRYQSEPTFEGISNNIVSNSVGINFLNSYLISEKWQITINLGYRYTDTKNSLNSMEEQIEEQIDETSHGFITDSSLSYTGESLNGSINISQTLLPSGLGQLNQQSGVGLALSYQFTERLSTALTANYLYSKPIGGPRTAAGDERQNITVSPSISYQISPDWRGSVSYSYRWQDQKRLEDQDLELDLNLQGFSADSNTIMLTLGYNWPGLSLSR